MRESKQVPDPRVTWPATHDPKTAAVFAQNTIDIAASAETIWGFLVDCVNWPFWYRYCADVSILRGGPVLTVGAKFRFKTLGFYFEPQIETFRPDRELSWSAKGPLGTSGAHTWFIEERSGGCRVITEEAQKGFLLRLVGRRTRRELLKSHQEWLRALKEQAERREAQAVKVS